MPDSQTTEAEPSFIKKGMKVLDFLKHKGEGRADALKRLKRKDEASAEALKRLLTENS
jgi:hypothetical protein